MITNRQKALIHVAKTKTGMTEDEYRAMLSGFGVESSKQLTQAKFEGVMRHFGKIGFRVQGSGFRTKGVAAGSRLSPGQAPLPQVPSSKELLRKKVRALMAEIGVRDGYVDAMAKHMFKVDSWLWLDADRLHKMVAALTYHRRRRSARVAENG